MATADRYLPLSFAASGNLTAKQYYAVRLVGTRTVALGSGAMLGVLDNKPDHGHAAEVYVYGEAKWVSDGSGTPIVAGDAVYTDHLGKAVQASGAGAKQAGIALEGSSADGLVIGVLLTPGGQIGA